eukprot:764569-Hanusia_phi.AAC.3
MQRHFVLPLQVFIIAVVIHGQYCPEGGKKRIPACCFRLKFLEGTNLNIRGGWGEEENRNMKSKRMRRSADKTNPKASMSKSIGGLAAEAAESDGQDESDREMFDEMENLIKSIANKGLTRRDASKGSVHQPSKAHVSPQSASAEALCMFCREVLGMRISEHEAFDQANPFAKKPALFGPDIVSGKIWSMSFTGNPSHCVLQVSKTHRASRGDVRNVIPCFRSRSLFRRCRDAMDSSHFNERLHWSIRLFRGHTAIVTAPGENEMIILDDPEEQVPQTNDPLVGEISQDDELENLVEHDGRDGKGKRPGMDFDRDVRSKNTGHGDIFDVFLPFQRHHCASARGKDVRPRYRPQLPEPSLRVRER